MCAKCNNLQQHARLNMFSKNKHNKHSYLQTDKYLPKLAGDRVCLFLVVSEGPVLGSPDDKSEHISRLSSPMILKHQLEPDKKAQW